MTATAITTGSSYQKMSPGELTQGIKAENSKALSMAKKSLEHVRNCGEMLIALKGMVGHGQWKYEVMNCCISQKTASNYMRIASNWQRVAVLDRGVKDALKLLCREDTPPPSKPETTRSVQPRFQPASSRGPFPLEMDRPTSGSSLHPA